VTARVLYHPSTASRVPRGGKERLQGKLYFYFYFFPRPQVGQGFYFIFISFLLPFSSLVPGKPSPSDTKYVLTSPLRSHDVGMPRVDPTHLSNALRSFPINTAAYLTRKSPIVMHEMSCLSRKPYCSGVDPYFQARRGEIDM
jgi:hypothetical protein